MVKQKYKSGCVGFFNFIKAVFFPVLFVIVSYASYFGYISYRVDIATVVSITAVFFLFLFLLPNNNFCKSCSLRNSFNKIEEELKQAIRKTLLKIGDEKKSTLKIDKFLDRYFKNSLNDSFSSKISWVFPLVGFVVMLLSVIFYDFSQNANDFKEILNDLKTYIWPFVYGILVGLWWAYLERNGVDKLKKSKNLFISGYSEYLWDKDMLDYYKLAQTQLNNEDLIDSLRENFNIHFMKQFNDSYIDTYKQLLSVTDESFKKINSELHESSRKIGKMLEDVSSSKNAIVATSEIDKKLENFNHAVKRLDDLVENSLGSVDKEISNIVKKLADFAEVVVKKSDDVESSINSYHKKIQKVIDAK